MTYMNLEKQHKNKYLPKALLLMQINMDKLLIYINVREKKGDLISSFNYAVVGLY